MKRTIEILLRLVAPPARLVALFFAAGAVGSAWAVTANVVWESDFGTSTKTGLDGKTYTLAFPTDCGSWLQQNGTIKIGSNSNAQGPTITVTGAVSGEKVSVLMEYADATAQSAAVPVYMDAGAYLGSQTKDNSLDVTGHWWNNGGVAYPTAGGTVTTMPSAGYLMYIFAQSENVEIYSAGTLAGLSEASAGGAVTGLNTANRKVSRIALGGVMIGGNGAGLTSRPVKNFTGLVIKRVAIFTSKISASEAAAYKFPSDETKVTVTEANTSWSTAFPSWDDSADNSDKTLFIEIQEGASLSKDTALSVKGLFVTGPGSLTLSGAVTASNGITIGSGATVSISANTGSAITNYGTLNVNGCSVTGTINNYGTIATSGTTSIQNASSQFYESGTLSVSGETTLRTANDINNDAGGLRGRVIINENARLISNYSATPYYSASLTLDLYGELALGSGVRWVVGGNTTVNVYSGGKITGGNTTDGGLDWRAGGGVINAYATSTFTAGIRARGSQTITVNVVGSDVVFSAPVYDGGQRGTITKTGAGTWKIENGTSSGKDIKNALAGSSGTVEIIAKSADYNFASKGSTFNGVLKLTNANSKQTRFDAGENSVCFAEGVRPELVMDSTATYFRSGAYNNTPLYVRDLSGKSGAIFDARYTTGPLTFILDTQQTTDTEYAGIFNSDGTRTFSLNVTGNNVGGVHTLTLSGVNTTTNTVTVSNYAKVKFSSTGKWANGIVVVGENGVLESQNSAAIAAKLKVEEGATLAFADGVQLKATAYDWSAISSEGSVNIDLSAVAPSATPVTLIASGVTVTADKFTVSDSQCLATLSVDNGALKATFANYWRDGSWSGATVANEDAALYISQNSTLTASEALSLGAVTVVKVGDSDVTLTVSGAGALATSGWTIPAGVTVVTADGMEIAGDVTGGGVINVPANTTLTMDGVTTPGDTLADRVKVAVFGTLKTKGTTTLSAANTSAAGSLIEVVADTTTLSSAFKGLSGNITIDSGAELSWAESIGSNSKDQYYDHINPDGTTVLDIAGTLHQNYRMTEFGANNKVLLRAGALVDGSIGSTDVTAYYGYGHWTWLDSGLGLHTYGNAELAIYIRTPENVAPEFTVDENVVLTISKAFIPQTGRQDGAGSIVKAGAGTLCLKNVAMTKPISGSEGTLQLLSDASGIKTHTATSSFSGKVIITRNTNGGHHEIGTSSDDDSNPGVFFLSGSPELEINGTAAYMCLNRSFAGKYMTVKNLSATSGTIDAKYTSGGTSKTIKCLQTVDTTYAGNFNGESTTARYVDLLVYGQNETVKTLTLSGASGSMKSYGTLTVKDYGKVKFSGSGDWAAGIVVVGANGYLESSSSAATLASTLTLQDGATMSFVPDKNVTVTTLNLPSGEGETVTFDINYVPALEGTTLISSSSITANTDVGMIQCENAIIKAEEEAIKAYPVATLTYTANEETTTTPYATVADAYMQAYMREAVLNTGYDYIAIYKTSSFSSYTQTIKVKPADGVTVTVTSGSPEYGSYTAGTADENGVITYTATPAPATYTWVSASQGDWSTAGKWKYSDGDYLQWATRCPQAGDTVIFNDGAAVTLDDTVSCATMAINGAVSISASAKSLNVSSAVTGTGTLTLSDVCIASAASGVTVAPPVTFTNDSEIAGSNPITFSSNVTVTGQMKVWDSSHVIAGDVDVSSGAIIITGASGNLTITGTTTFNGNFRKQQGSTLTFGAVNVAVSTAITVDAGSVVFGGTVTIPSEKTLTIPASSVTYSGATFDGAGKVAFGAVPSSVTTAGTWTGTVELPSFVAAGQNFNNYGRAGSKVLVNGITSGWLAMGSDSTKKYTYNPEVILAGNITLTDSSTRICEFTKLSGSGTLSLTPGTNGFKITVTVLEMVGDDITIVNNMENTFTVTKVTLDAAPAVDDCILASSTPNNVSVTSVYVGNTQQDVILEKKTDGIYVAATAETETVGGDTVTVLDTGSNTAVDASSLSLSGKVAIPGTVAQITGVAAENLLLKVTYTPDGGNSTTGYYAGILTLDNSGNVSLDGSATVGGVKVQPETAEDSPMTFTGSSPSFTVKAIPGLWYQVLAADSVNDGALVSPVGGTAVQATTTTVSPAAPAFSGTVQYYKIAVGASQAALQ